jgi:hypothetical protein
MFQQGSKYRAIVNSAYIAREYGFDQLGVARLLVSNFHFRRALEGGLPSLSQLLGMSLLGRCNYLRKVHGVYYGYRANKPGHFFVNAGSAVTDVNKTAAVDRTDDDALSTLSTAVFRRVDGQYPDCLRYMSDTVTALSGSYDVDGLFDKIDIHKLKSMAADPEYHDYFSDHDRSFTNAVVNVDAMGKLEKFKVCDIAQRVFVRLRTENVSRVIKINDPKQKPVKNVEQFVMLPDKSKYSAIPDGEKFTEWELTTLAKFFPEGEKVVTDVGEYYQQNTECVFSTISSEFVDLDVITRTWGDESDDDFVEASEELKQPTPKLKRKATQQAEVATGVKTQEHVTCRDALDAAVDHLRKHWSKIAIKLKGDAKIEMLYGSSVGEELWENREGDGISKGKKRELMKQLKANHKYPTSEAIETVGNFIKDSCSRDDVGDVDFYLLAASRLVASKNTLVKSRDSKGEYILKTD